RWRRRADCHRTPSTERVNRPAGRPSSCQTVVVTTLAPGRPRRITPPLGRPRAPRCTSLLEGRAVGNDMPYVDGNGPYSVESWTYLEYAGSNQWSREAD